MERSMAPSRPVSATAYTDLQGLQSLKNEKDQDVALKKVAEQFESIFVHELLKNMRSANKVFEENNLFDSSESDVYRDMYDQQLSLNLSKQGLGIADVLYEQLKGNYGKGDTSGTASGDRSFAVPSRSASSNPSASLAEQQSTSKAVAAAGAADVGQSSESREALTPFETAQDFVDAMLPVAQKIVKHVGLNPVMLVAQAALETGWGKHVLKDDQGNSSFNLFNIKADKSWSGDSVGTTTLEYRDGTAVKETAAFRRYESFAESIEDFVQFIQQNPRYQEALSVVQDSEQFIEQLHRAGYATDPNYSQKVLSVFERLQTQVGGPSAAESR